MKKILFFIFLVSIGCNKICDGSELSGPDLNRVRKLGLLQKDEKIKKFYSEHKNSVAGNFFTDKRVVKYWIDPRNNAKDIRDVAFYSDIKDIIPVYNAGLTHAPYFKIVRKNKSSFRVCFDGDKKELKKVFNELNATWKAKR